MTTPTPTKAVTQSEAAAMLQPLFGERYPIEQAVHGALIVPLADKNKARAVIAGLTYAAQEAAPAWDANADTFGTVDKEGNLHMALPLLHYLGDSASGLSSREHLQRTADIFAQKFHSALYANHPDYVVALAEIHGPLRTSASLLREQRAAERG